MPSYAFDLLRGGEQRAPELLSSATRRRAEGAHDGSGGTDTRRESDSEQLAA